MGIALDTQLSCLIETVLVGTHSYLTEVLVRVDSVSLYASIICVNLWILSRAAYFRHFWDRYDGYPWLSYRSFSAS